MADRPNQCRLGRASLLISIAAILSHQVFTTFFVSSPTAIALKIISDELPGQSPSSEPKRPSVGAIRTPAAPTRTVEAVSHFDHEPGVYHIHRGCVESGPTPRLVLLLGKNKTWSPQALEQISGDLGVAGEMEVTTRRIDTSSQTHFKHRFHPSTTLALKCISSAFRCLRTQLFSLAPALFSSLKRNLDVRFFGNCTERGIEWCAGLTVSALRGSGAIDVGATSQSKEEMECFEHLLVPKWGLFQNVTMRSKGLLRDRGKSVPRVRTLTGTFGRFPHLTPTYLRSVAVNPNFSTLIVDSKKSFLLSPSEPWAKKYSEKISVLVLGKGVLRKLELEIGTMSLSEGVVVHRESESNAFSKARVIVIKDSSKIQSLGNIIYTRTGTIIVDMNITPSLNPDLCVLLGLEFYKEVASPSASALSQLIQSILLERSSFYAKPDPIQISAKFKKEFKNAGEAVREGSLAVVLQTHTSYWDTWSIGLDLLARFMLLPAVNRGFKIPFYICINEFDPRLPSWATQVEYGNNKTHYFNKSITCFENIPTHKVVLPMQDDWFVSGNIDWEKLVLSYMIVVSPSNNISAVETMVYAGDPVQNNNTLSDWPGLWHRKEANILPIQPLIWRQESFIRHLLSLLNCKKNHRKKARSPAAMEWLISNCKEERNLDIFSLLGFLNYSKAIPKPLNHPARWYAFPYINSIVGGTWSFEKFPELCCMLSEFEIPTSRVHYFKSNSTHEQDYHLKAFSKKDESQLQFCQLEKINRQLEYPRWSPRKSWIDAYPGICTPLTH
ncbi:hypothetical protein AAMO2058_001090700 [Amorphochlora amoebiformis]